MDAAWKKAISEGKKAGGKLGAGIKQTLNKTGLTNSLSKTALKTGIKVGGAVGAVGLGAVGAGLALKSRPLSISSLKNAKNAATTGAFVGKAAGKTIGFSKTASLLNKTGVRTGMRGKLNLK